MNMFSRIDAILYQGWKTAPEISAVDHYCGHEKLILKSLELQNQWNGIFDVTCDLEDGASVGQESALRNLVKNILHSNLNIHKKVGIRIHEATSSEFLVDLEFFIKNCGKIISHLTIPKIADYNQAQKVINTIENECKVNNISVPPIHFLIELPSAVHEVWNIASLKYLRGLDFGCMDYVSSFNGAVDAENFYSPGQFEHPLLVRAKASIIEACAVHGLVAAHNVTPNFKDPDIAFDDALRAKSMFGFTRMWSIHPNQIKPILNAMKPALAEIERACAIVLEAQKNHWSPISFEDKLHDRASYRYFWSIVKRAKSSGAPLPTDTDSLFE